MKKKIILCVMIALCSSLLMALQTQSKKGLVGGRPATTTVSFNDKKVLRFPNDAELDAMRDQYIVDLIQRRELSTPCQIVNNNKAESFAKEYGLSYWYELSKECCIIGIEILYADWYNKVSWIIVHGEDSTLFIKAESN